MDTHAIPDKTQMLTLARRPGNDIHDDDFALVTRTIEEPKAGQVVMRNHVTSVDPYQIRMMRGGEGHSDQQIGDVIHAGCVGVVVVSNDPKAPVGTGTRIGTRMLNVAFATVRDEAGIDPTLDLHSLRHSYVTHLVEFDYPERFIQEQVGHSFSSTTAIYVGVSNEYRNRLISQSMQSRYGHHFDRRPR